MSIHEKRLQRDLRRAVDQKIAEGYAILRREPDLIMSRGGSKIIFEFIGQSIVIKAA